MYGTDGAVYVVYTLWFLWKQRNEKLFKGVDLSSAKLLQLIRAQVQERVRVSGSAQNSALVRWIPPSIGELKMNFDGSFTQALESGGAGYVVRDCVGKVILAGGSPMSASSPLETEERELWEGVQVLKLKMPGVKIWIEGDSQQCIDQLNNAQHLGISNLMQEVLNLFASITGVRCSFVSRELNRAADFMAKFVRRANLKLLFEGEFPEGLMQLTVKDIS